MCYMSGARCHVSCVRCTIFFVVVKVVELVDARSVINRAYPSSFKNMVSSNPTSDIKMSWIVASQFSLTADLAPGLALSLSTEGGFNGISRAWPEGGTICPS